MAGAGRSLGRDFERVKAPQTLWPPAQRIVRWAPALISLACAVLIGRNLALLAWGFTPIPESARWHAPPAAEPIRSVAAATEMATGAAASLFGRPPPASASTAAAPDTALDLELVGILADSRSDGQSRALIRAGTETEKPYAVGDLVASAATVKAIFFDRVLLLRQGVLETLRLHRPELAGIGGGTMAAGATEAAATPPANESLGAKLTRARQEALSEPGAIENYVHLSPQDAASGGPSGFRVTPGADASLFNAAGLHAGDVVTAVNGRPITDPSKAMGLVSSISATSQIILTVQHPGGSSEPVVLNFGH